MTLGPSALAKNTAVETRGSTRNGPPRCAKNLGSPRGAHFLAVVLYGQYKVYTAVTQSSEPMRTDGGTDSGDPLAFIAGAIAGGLIGSSIGTDQAIVFSSLGLGFLLYEISR